jgi:protein disulfide-isomerase-like protein
VPWLERVLAGTEREAPLKSAPRPEDDRGWRPGSGGVRTLVGSTFVDAVEDGETDVLVKYFAPWCGHCKRMAPAFREAAAKFAGVKTVLFAEIDGTENELPARYAARGYPTLWMVPAGARSEPKALTARSVDELVAAVERHAALPFAGASAELASVLEGVRVGAKEL